MGKDVGKAQRNNNHEAGVENKGHDEHSLLIYMSRDVEEAQRDNNNCP